MVVRKFPRLGGYKGNNKQWICLEDVSGGMA